MKISIVSGSHRANSQSDRVADYFSGRIKALGDHDIFSLSLANNPLPLWDETIWSGGEHWKDKWSPIAKEFQSSDAFVIISPEWHGMVPSGLKNLFLLCTNKELGHKPGLIVSVSGSRNGAYPVSELRMSSTKNNRLVYIPDHIIVRDVESMFKEPTPQSSDEDYLRKRIDYSLSVLNQYGTAMKQIRDSGVIDFESYGNGM